MQILNRMKSSGPSSTVPRPAASMATGTSKCGFPDPESETVRWGCGTHVTRISSPGVLNVRPQQTCKPGAVTSLNHWSWGSRTSFWGHCYLFPELFTPISWPLAVVIWQEKLFGLCPPSLLAQPSWRIWAEPRGMTADGPASCCWSAWGIKPDQRAFISMVTIG